MMYVPCSGAGSGKLEQSDVEYEMRLRLVELKTARLNPHMLYHHYKELGEKEVATRFGGRDDAAADERQYELEEYRM